MFEMALQIISPRWGNHPSVENNQTMLHHEAFPDCEQECLFVSGPVPCSSGQMLKVATVYFSTDLL